MLEAEVDVLCQVTTTAVSHPSDHTFPPRIFPPRVKLEHTP